MSYGIIAGILLAGLALAYGIKRRLQTKAERECLENMYYWTVLTLCYAFSSILYVCFHAGEIGFSGEYRNGFGIVIGILVLVLFIDIASPSGGIGKVTGMLKWIRKRDGMKKDKWKKENVKISKYRIHQASSAFPDFSAAKEDEMDIGNGEEWVEDGGLGEEGKEERDTNQASLKIPLYVSHKKFKQKIHDQAEDTYNMFYRFTSLVFTGFLIVLPFIRRVTYNVSENNEWIRKHLSDAFLSISGFCLIAMTAICIRQLWYQLRFMRRLPLNKKSFSRMGRSVQANEYMNKKHKVL